MRRFRISTKSLTSDPSGDLRRLSMVRRDLYAHSPIEVDPDNPAFRTQRDADGRAYFEFSTSFEPRDVEDVLTRFHHDNYVELRPIDGPAGTPCLSCGYIGTGPLPATCPQCGFQDISPCPHCGESISRESYVQIAGDLFRCPNSACRAFVRLRFNEPLITSDGNYNQPVVLVEEAAEVPA
jgi:hypothetical protein